MPTVVNNIVWARQLESKVKDTLATAETLLGGLSGFAGFQREANEFKDELKEYQKNQFDAWSRDILTSISHPTEPLRYSGVTKSVCRDSHLQPHPLLLNHIRFK